jgi:hypothetical protein
MKDLGCLPESARFHLLAAQSDVYSTVMKALLVGLLAVAANASPILVSGWGDAAQSAPDDGGLELFLSGLGVDINFMVQGRWLGRQNILCPCNLSGTGFSVGSIAINGVSSQHYALSFGQTASDGALIGTATVFDISSNQVLAFADIQTYVASSTVLYDSPLESETQYVFATQSANLATVGGEQISAIPEPATGWMALSVLFLFPSIRYARSR